MPISGFNLLAGPGEFDQIQPLQVEYPGASLMTVEAAEALINDLMETAKKEMQESLEKHLNTIHTLGGIDKEPEEVRPPRPVKAKPSTKDKLASKRKLSYSELRRRK